MVENYRGDMESLGGKTTVKVHAPPGGKTSISLFGGYGDDSPKAKKAQPAAAAAVAVPEEEEEKKDEQPKEEVAAGGKVGAA